MAEEQEAINIQFEDAVDALRQGERARGREILTRLLKTDQNNPNYWIWMSAAVDTAKERIYCLETALKLDPANAIAKRGLVLLGGLPADEHVQPFPLNRPRPWEDDLLLAHEKPEEKGVAGMMASPVTRIAGVALLGLAAVGLAAYLFFFNPRATQLFRPLAASTAGPSATFTPTPTFVNATSIVLPTQSGPTPLAIMMGVSYTPTPLYINTPRSPLTGDIYRSAKAAYDKGDWATYIQQMQEIQKAEPKAADVPFYIGEGYRFKGDCRTALNFYNQSLQVDNNFAPGYVGLARARICIDPGADTTQLYDLAAEADPAYAQTYLDRANFSLVRRDFAAALPDLQQAETLLPDSALVQLGFAEAYLMSGDKVKALDAAKRANSIDQTLLPSYFFLGYAYSANAQYADAIKPLQIYLIYQPRDPSAYGLLGQAYSQTGDYKSAVEALQKGLRYDPSQVRSYVYLGTANLRLGNLDAAEDNLKRALQYFPDSFDANIGLTETMYRKGTFGSAYLQAETSKSKATNDTQRALALYWRALSQEGRNATADAIADWKALLAMPGKAMTAQMRQTAEEHLTTLVIPSATPKGGVRTATASPTPARTATSKPSSGTPTRIPTASPTRTP